MRILHFSDVHVQENPARMPVKELMGKRLVGAANLAAGRWRLFRHALEKLAWLHDFSLAEQVDAVICTGDFTALGTEREMRSARAAAGPLMAAPLGCVVVPGNHDLYVADTLRDHRFERHFGDLLGSDMPEYAVGGPWPAVRMWGDDCAVVTVNSAVPNPGPLRSSGRIDDAQIGSLRRLLGDARMRGRTVFVATHYGPLRRDGKPDHPHHGLENVEALMQACMTHPGVVLIHGHIHWGYHHPPEAEGRPRLFCAGSCTHAGRESGWLYELSGQDRTATPVRLTDDRYVLQPDELIRW